MAYEDLVERFAALFDGATPSFVVRVPGRVNLIGEHTDYNGLPVMPMAIERDIRLAVAPRGDSVVELHSSAQQFTSRRFSLAHEIEPFATGDWGNYAKAGVQGVMRYLADRSPASWRGYSALVDSNLPLAAGLSSSSALVVASAIAALTCNDLKWDRRRLAEEMAAAERYVGTMGGGMDHAAVLLSEAGAALKIDFFPLRTTPVPLPAGYSVVICNSMVVAPKTAAARILYNSRPIECRLAAAIVARHLGWSGERLLALRRLSELLPHITMPQLAETAEEALAGERWSKERVAQVLGFPVSVLEEHFLRLAGGQVLPTPEKGLPLLHRMRHVLTEGERVRAAAEALAGGDAHALGSLMRESHASCRDNFGISCPELEQLVATALEAGALGSRLTGAGFGGCTVNLVHSCDVERFRAAITAGYYEGYLGRERPTLYAEAKAHRETDLVVTSAPANGATVVSLR